MVQLALHAHMPYVLNTPMEYWLYEASVNCYFPLIDMLLRSPKAKVVLHVSPSLINQWQCPKFAEKFSYYCFSRKKAASNYQGEGEELCSQEAARLNNFAEKITAHPAYFIDTIKDLKNKGKIEILTGTATHAFLPLWKNFPPWAKLQIEVGKEISKSVFGKLKGFWFPECALDAELCQEAENCGIEYTYADPSCLGGNYLPAIRWKGLALFIRNRELGDLIWDAERGYPGSSVYRDFHADFISEQTAPFTLPRAGFSLRAVGDRYSADKPFYCVKKAKIQAQIHAQQFLNSLPKNEPCTLAFDAELFGHWWHEGVYFLENLFELAPPYFFVHPKDILAQNPPQQKPLPSTWGTGCDASSWINPQTAALTEKLLTAQAHISSGPKEMRAFMLAQASDWPFLISHGSFAANARDRVENLLSNPPNDKDLLYQVLAKA